MKILEEKNGHKMTFVEAVDVDFLLKNNYHMPRFVYETYIDSDFSDKHKFIELSGDEAYEYFKNIYWIIDYKEINKLANAEINDKLKVLTKHYQSLLEKLRKNPQDDNIRKTLLQTIRKISSYNEFLEYRKGKLKLDIPSLVSDFETEHINYHENNYNIDVNLDNNEIYFSKKDGLPFSIGETVDSSLIDSICSIEFMNKFDVIPKKHEFYLSFSDDRKYLIVQRVEVKKKPHNFLERILEKKDID